MFKIKFNNRPTFALALTILKQNQDEIFESYQSEDSFYDVGYADMIISFASRLIMNACIDDLSVAQIWSEPSFKGTADFEIIP